MIDSHILIIYKMFLSFAHDPLFHFVQDNHPREIHLCIPHWSEHPQRFLFQNVGILPVPGITDAGGTMQVPLPVDDSIDGLYDTTDESKAFRSPRSPGSINANVLMKIALRFLSIQPAVIFPTLVFCIPQFIQGYGRFLDTSILPSGTGRHE